MALAAARLRWTTARSQDSPRRWWSASVCGSGSARPASSLDRARDGAMQQRAPGRQHPAVDDLADAIVSEVEAVAHVVEHLAAHELLDGLGRVRLGGAGGVPEEPERERPADHGGHRGELAAPRAEALEPPRDHRADAVRHRARRAPRAPDAAPRP